MSPITPDPDAAAPGAGVCGPAGGAPPEDFGQVIEGKWPSPSAIVAVSRRSRFPTLVAGKSTPTRLARRAEHIDVHLVSREGSGHARHHLAWPLAGPRSRRVRAAQASAEAAALTRLATSVLRGRSDPPALLEEIREMFCLDAASAGDQAPEAPGADTEFLISETFTLAARGRALGREDTRVPYPCAALVVAGIMHGREAEHDAHAAEQATGPRSRDALIARLALRLARDLAQAMGAALRCDQAPDGGPQRARPALVTTGRWPGLAASRLLGAGDTGRALLPSPAMAVLRRRHPC